MRIRGIGRLKRTARSVTNLFVPRAIILLYHRVTDLASDPQLLSVSPQHFAEHLDIIRKVGRQMQLTSLEQTLHHEKRRGCGVIVTFDDGYGDNLYNAKPLLERYDVSATVFVTTGYIGAQREFWQDELERIFLQPTRLPETLGLKVGGNFYEWNLDKAAHYDDAAYESYRGWNVSQKENPTLRHEIYRALVELLEHLPNDKQREILNDLLSWAGIQRISRPTHRALLPEEVIQLADGGLVEIASHTVNHPVLSSLPACAQKNEIAISKARLEEILGRQITSFAYPYGRRSDYTNDTITAVREAGFHYACSNFPGCVDTATDLWQLPRFLVRDWNGDEFAARLRGWLTS